MNSIMTFMETVTKNSTGSIQELSLGVSEYGPAFRPFHTAELNPIQSAVSVKKLYIEAVRRYDVGFFLPSDSFMVYLMKKFPNVSSITLKNSDGDDCFSLEDTTITQSSAVIIQFLIYLSKIRSATTDNILFCFEEEHTGRIIQDVYHALDKNIDFSFPRRLEIKYDSGFEPERGNILPKLMFINLKELRDNNLTIQQMDFTLHGNDRLTLFQQQFQLVKHTG